MSTESATKSGKGSTEAATALAFAAGKCDAPYRAEDSTCWVCCEHSDGLIVTGCACRGSSGMAHLECLVAAARHDVDGWTTCPTCGQFYTGEAEIGLALARYELVRDREEHDEEKLFVKNNLAVAMKECTNDSAGALKLMEEVLSVRRHTLGNDAAATLDSIANLALQHTEMGNFETALPLSIEAVVGTRRLHGAEHPHTLVAIGSLAALQTSRRDFVEAQKLHEEALDGRRRVLGPDHLDTLNSLFGLGCCLVGQCDGLAPSHVASNESCATRNPASGDETTDKRTRGIQLMQEAATAAQRVLGDAHPTTQHFQRGLQTAIVRSTES